MQSPMSVDLNLPEDRVGPRVRRASKRVWVGGVPIGDGAPIAVQSMCTTLTHDIEATIRQIERLQEAGCEIVRVAVPDRRAGEALKELVRRSILPLVADIHFDYKLALMALDAKVHKLRLNPGNIHNKDGVREVVKRAKEQGTPIRIGVNFGSIPDKEPGDLRDDAQRMVDLALSEIRILEELDFTDIIVSVKAFEVPKMIAAYRRLAKAIPYPLHLGVTESGTLLAGSVRSTAGMSVLLYEGIGDTIRVSLSEDPVTEVKAAFDMLKSLELRDQGLTLVACPSCGRADIDLIPLAKVAEERLRALPVPMKIAVMGCEVNGPGEAKDADVGIAGGVGKGAIFRKGKVVGVYPEADLMDALLAEIDKILVENGKEPYSQKAPKVSHEGQLTPVASSTSGERRSRTSTSGRLPFRGSPPRPASSSTATSAVSSSIGGGSRSSRAPCRACFASAASTRPTSRRPTPVRPGSKAAPSPTPTSRSGRRPAPSSWTARSQARSRSAASTDGRGVSPPSTWTRAARSTSSAGTTSGRRISSRPRSSRASTSPSNSGRMVPVGSTWTASTSDRSVCELS